MDLSDYFRAIHCAENVLGLHPLVFGLVWGLVLGWLISGHTSAVARRERAKLPPHVACGEELGPERIPCDRRDGHRGKHVATTDEYHYERSYGL